MRFISNISCADVCSDYQDKCDGLRPACSACQATGQICSYDPNAKKRGLPEGYVRGLEKLWALAICNVDGFEDTMLGLLGGTPDSANRRNKLMSLWSDDSVSETLHETWKTSRTFGALERMLSTSDVPPPQIQDKRQRDERGDAATGVNWGLRITRSSTPLGPDAPRVTEPSASPNAKRPRLSSPGTNATLPYPGRRPSTLQLPPQTSQLLDVYFAVTHTWFPIVTKHNILRASYIYSNAPFSIENANSGSGDHAALWAILSYTVSQSKRTHREEAPTLFAKAKEYYSISRKLIPSEEEHYELGHVQALLLLTLVNIGFEDWIAAWSLNVQAVRTAVAMGPGTYLDTRRPDEMGQERTVFLGCFVVDSLLSFRLGRTPCLHPHDIAIVARLEEDGLEEWNPWADVLPLVRGVQAKNPPRPGPLLALSSFNRLVELASILNRITRDSSDGSTAHVFTHQIVSELKQYDDYMLLGCPQTGPESLYPKQHSPLLPHQTYLGLTYVAIVLWIHLRIAPKELGLHPKQRPATEDAKKLLPRSLTMISQHLENFQMCGLPPIFEATLRTIGSQAISLRDIIEPGAFPFPQWMEGLLQSAMELKSTWPVYGSLVSTIEHWDREIGAETSPMSLQGPASEVASAPSGGLRKGGMAMPEMGQMGHPRLQSEFPINQQGRTSPLRENPNLDYTSSIFGISIPEDRNYTTAKDSERRNADFFMTDGSPESTNRSVDFLDRLAQSNSPDLMQSPTHPQPTASSASNVVPPANAACRERNLPFGDPHDLNTWGSRFDEPDDMANDIDSIFRDLAYLDTTEWAVGREAGLKDFGFMDDTTFQAFCHDPDRLEGYQPLDHPSSIADIWPPPGFFPEAFQENTNDAMDR